MTVKEYSFNFTQLARYAPHVVADSRSKMKEQKIKQREKQNKRAKIGSFNFAQPKSEGENRSQFRPKSSVPAPSTASAPVSKFREGRLLTIECIDLTEQNLFLYGYGAIFNFLGLLGTVIYKGIIKIGLGNRIAYQFIKLFGSSSLGLGYSLVSHEALLAPAISSISARTGGIFLPLVKSISVACDSNTVDGTENKLGSWLMLTCFQTSVISSSIFLMTMAVNPLSASKFSLDYIFIRLYQYLSAYSSHDKFINKKIDMFDEMSLVCGSDRARGNCAK
ncbi:hypothetical protein T459_16243 [Capsicum annuum]|uniref:Uncharacterized protein n=1 Tax=Capsicum annuum TaxID=4072 RepID=A0A2G2Z8F8_CAPAN|nr:hypothetical protein T459_16243 [Capsicum annuum]